MKNQPDNPISRRDLLRIGGLGLLATGCASALHAQTATPPALAPRYRGMTHVIIRPDNPSVVRVGSLCTHCGLCVDYCNRVATVQGHRSTEGRMSCTHCGQCTIQCEYRSITERSEIATFQSAVDDTDKIVIVMTAPAVRVAMGEMFAMPSGSYVEGKTVAALKKLGCDYVVDVTFGADLAIMEEASELLCRLETNSDSPYPMFTSCCPAWVRFAELFMPPLVPHISPVKSPIMIQGAAIKTYFAQKHGLNPKKIFTVAITPCTAKKAEIKRPDWNTLADQPGFEGLAEVDLALTARELGAVLHEKNIDFANLSNASYDSLMGKGSGSGLGFGGTGGVMASALHTAYYFKNGTNPPLQKDIVFRGAERTVNWVNLMPLAGRIPGVRTDTINLGDRTLRIAVVETTGSLRGLLDVIEHDGERFDFVEVMACRHGCLGGGGQPYPLQLAMLQELAYDRRDALQSGVDQSVVRLSHENSEVATAYREFFGAPFGDKAKTLLHRR